MKRILFVIVFIFLETATLFSQTPTQNLKKYWYLRWRLKNYFMVVGDGPGMSIPAGIRNTASSERPYGIDWYSQWLGFGDDPNYLGKYIGVLATEYKLLSENGLNTSETIEELYYAIKAINRLDECENKFPWFNSQSSLDGMCSRGDADTGFVRRHFNELNQNLERFNRSIAPGDPDPVQKVRIGSSYNYDMAIVPSKRAGMMSQDHISTIFVGLALVKKFIPEWETYSGMPIRQEAKNIAKRILNYMERCDWHLKNPDEVHIDEGLGSKAWPFSYGFAKAASFIYPEHTLDFMAGAKPLANKVTWDGIATVYLGATDICTILGNNGVNVGACENSRNTWIILNLACVGNSWESVALDLSLVSPYFAPLGLACIAPGLDCTQGLIWAHSKVYGWEAYYPLLHAVLQNSGCLTDQNQIEGDLNSMPCSGHWGGPGGNSPGWATSHKYHDIPEENILGDPGFPGIYNGLEYMLLFNLYSIHEDGDYIEDYQKILGDDINILGNYPKLSPIEYSSSMQVDGAETGGPLLLHFPQYVSSMGNITSSAVIKNNIAGTYYNYYTLPVVLHNPYNVQANVTYRSTETVHLAPGFHAEAGTKFHAYVEPIHCNSSGDYVRLGQSRGEKPKENHEENTQVNSLKKEQSEEVISENGPNPEFQIIPNPNNGSFALVFPTKQGNNSQLTITNMIGEIVFKGSTTENRAEIKLESLKPGIYTINLFTNNSYFVRKMVIQ